MKRTRLLLNGLLALGSLCASQIGAAQQATHQVQVLYVIPNGQTARPQAEEAIGAMMSIVQRHYLQQLGRTFELKSPLVQTVNIPLDAEYAGDWGHNYQVVAAHLAEDYFNNNNVVVTIIEGSPAPAGGSWNIVKITGEIWDDTYNTYRSKPHILPQKVVAISQGLGLAFGLKHSAATKQCLADRGVDMGSLPNLLMHATYDAGRVYNYPFHEMEKNLLLDPAYYPECRPFLNGRPHASSHLYRMSIQPYPSANGRNVNVVQLADFDGTWLGEFSKRGAEWWTGKGVLPVAKQADESYRDDWSVYLYRPIDRTHFQLDLHTKKVKVKDPRYGSYDFLAIVDASAEVNGRVASQVFYTNNWRGDETGMFVQASDGQWLEQSLPDKQTRFRFREVGRDDWSVYLYDQSRDVHVQLDMYSDVMRVNFRMGYESSFRPLYNILLAK